MRFDRRLIDEALASAPRRWPVASRGSDETLVLEDGRVYFGTGSDCLYVADPESGERRRGTLSDVEALAALCEALPNIDFVMSMVSPADVSPEHEVLAQQVALLKGTRKPLLITPRDGHQLARMKEMAAVCGRGDSLIVYAMPSPPLMHDEFALTKVMESAKLAMPLVYSPAPAASTSAPASVSAVAVVANAEVLSGLVLHQAVSPGAPFIYGTGCDIFDMRTMINPYVTPGWCQGGQAGCDLAHFYGLPSFSYAGFSDSKMLDEQWSAETALTAIVGGLSRGTLLHDVGYLESGLQTSFEAIVLGDELVGFVKSLLGEVSTDEQALAVDEIIAVGPGGNHLGRAYTRRHYRQFLELVAARHHGPRPLGGGRPPQPARAGQDEDGRAAQSRAEVRARRWQARRAGATGTCVLSSIVGARLSRAHDTRCRRTGTSTRGCDCPTARLRFGPQASQGEGEGAMGTGQVRRRRLRLPIAVGVIVLGIGLVWGLGSALAVTSSPSPTGKLTILRIGTLQDADNLNPSPATRERPMRSST